MIVSNLFDIWTSKEQEMGRRLTLKTVSEATGISQPTLSRWMNGQVRRFGSKTIQALCEFFGCTIAELLIEGEEG